VRNGNEHIALHGSNGRSVVAVGVKAKALEHARDATAAAADPAGGAQSSAAGLDLPRIRPAGWRCSCHGRSRSSSSPGRRSSRLRIRPTVVSAPLPVPCNVTSRFSRWVQCMVATSNYRAIVFLLWTTVWSLKSSAEIAKQQCFGALLGSPSNMQPCILSQDFYKIFSHARDNSPVFPLLEESLDG
jgi:hypothetical protein